jgi:micrococcal nuclease
VVKTVVLVVALAVAGATCQKPSEPAAPGQATVTKVVDGDTLHIRIGRSDDKVRLVGIDTPETHGPGGLRECFGQEATHRMEELLPDGTTVTVVRDVEARDRYGRLLAYVYRASDGLFVNLAMARDGFAVALSIAPNVAHAAEFAAAVSDARRANRGLWPACGGADKRIP